MFKYLPWIISAVLLLLLTIGILTRPDPNQDSSQAYKDTIEQLRSERAVESSRTKAIQKTYSDSVKILESIVGAKDKQISLLQKKRTALRPVILPQVDSLPMVKRFIALQDSVIEFQGEQIDTLKLSVKFQNKMFDDLVVSHTAEASISQRIEQEQENRIVNLEKQVKKVRRQVKLMKVVAIVGTVSGIFLGSR